VIRLDLSHLPQELLTIIESLGGIPQRPRRFLTTEEARQVIDQYNNQSIEQQLASLFCLEINGQDNGNKFNVALDFVNRFGGLGAIVPYGYMARELVLAANLIKTKSQEHGLSTALFIDAECGLGGFWNDGKPLFIPDATWTPGIQALSSIGDQELGCALAYCMGLMIGREVAWLGEATLSPECDVVDGRNLEGPRSFGNAQRVCTYASYLIQGCIDGGTSVIIKHFPGRGNWIADPNNPGFNYVDRHNDNLWEQNIRPFRNCGPNVVGALVEYTEVDACGKLLPTVINPGQLHNLHNFLRNGLVVSDDLCLKYVCDRYGAEEIVRLALLSGCDILLKPTDPFKAFEYILAAAKKDRHARRRIGESSLRKALFDARHGLNLPHGGMANLEMVGKVVGCPQHRALAQYIANESVIMLDNTGDLLPLSEEWRTKQCNIHNIVVTPCPDGPLPAAIEREMQARFPVATINMSAAMPDNPNWIETCRGVPEADLVFVWLLVSDRNTDNTLVDLHIRLISWRAEGKMIVFSFGGLRQTDKIRGNPTLCGSAAGGWGGNPLLYVQAFLDVVLGIRPPRGRLPLSIDLPVGELPEGYGLTWENND